MIDVRSNYANKNLLHYSEKNSLLNEAPSHGRRQKGAAPPPWIFIHDTDKIEGSLMMLFFGVSVHLLEK